MERLLPWGFWAAWILLMAVWLVSAFFVKSVQRDTSTALRIGQGLLMVAGYSLIANAFPIGWLNHQLIPVSLPQALIGLALTWLGVAYAIWARASLGRNWSAKPMLKQGHELITIGPYRITRHPIYTGMLTAGIGTALAVARVSSVLGVAFILTAMLIKIRQEEALMCEAFPTQYPDYRSRVKGLFPLVW